MFAAALQARNFKGEAVFNHEEGILDIKVTKTSCLIKSLAKGITEVELCKWKEMWKDPFEILSERN